MIRKWKCLLAGVAVIAPVLTGCTTPAPAAGPAASIGSATMARDGTITLQLMALAPGGVRGDALLTYRPGDPNYAKIRRHLGGLKPGEHKAVPPWPTSTD